MVKSFREKLENFNKTNFSGLFYEFGITPDEMKSLIIEQFQNYFQNRRNLEKYAITHLTTSWFSFLSIQRDYKDTLKYIDISLRIYNSAKERDKELVINAYAKWFPDFSQSITRFWSFYYGQEKFDELCDEDYLSKMFQLIGQLIEGMAKPFLQFTLYLNRLSRTKPIEIEGIKNKDLGVIIDELIGTSELKEMLVIDTIRLNQWRNIAYHHNTKIVNGKMFYFFKRNGVTEEFEITRDELKRIARLINNIVKLLRIAETILCIDNLQEIQQSVDTSDTSQINFRKESELLEFNFAISSQGFKISDLEYDENNATLDLIDLEAYGDATKKSIHSSQFLYPLWILTQSKHLKVNYYLFNGIKFFTSEISSNDFKERDENVTAFSELMKNVKFTYININVKQNVNPFENPFFSKDVINDPSQFYSQQGERISLNEFAKQFTQSVFCNYLALKAEGFDDVKINIGGDGAMVRVEQPKPLVLVVPATIKSRLLQQELIALLQETIRLYENTLLSLDVVNDSKNSNDYVRKIALIKDQKNSTP